jgi:hypothetical protein
MAEEEAVERLRHSVVEWNAWRRVNPMIHPDLSGADLSRANLISANLSCTKLRDANLCYADLSGTNLCLANLTGANLSEADLRGADLFDADLEGANLTQAKLYETDFANVNLTSVIGLEICVHEGPSTIDHRTLQKSGTLPLSFLRGVGLPDNLIEYLPSLLNRPIQHYSCFISYRAKEDDEEFAKRLHADLQNKGVRCWFARAELRARGARFEGAAGKVAVSGLLQVTRKSSFRPLSSRANSHARPGVAKPIPLAVTWPCSARPRPS